MKKKIFVILCLMFVGINVNALCTNSEYTRLKEKADKMEFASNYKIVTVDDYLSNPYNDLEFSITAYNMDSELDVAVSYSDYYYTSDAVRFTYNKSQTATLNQFSSGKIKIVVSSNKGECKGRNIVTKTMNLPYYNLFYSTDKCKDYPQFKYCLSDIVESYVNEVIFDKELNKYVESLKKEEKKEDKSNQGIAIWKIIRTIVIIVFIVSIVGYGAFKIIQRERRRRSL